MLLAMKIKAVITAAALAGPLALTIGPANDSHHAHSGITEIAAKPFRYRLPGDFSRDGKPAAAPLHDARLAAGVRIMTRQVTAGEYARCTEDGGCPKIPHASLLPDRPMVGVSWRDGLCGMADKQDRDPAPAADRRGMGICGRGESPRRGIPAGRPGRSGPGVDRAL